MKRSSSLSTRSLRSILASLVLLLAAAVIPEFPSAQAQSAPTSRPSSTAIRTPDFDETLRWYQDKLGFRLIGSENFVQGRTAVLERSGFLLEVTEVDHLLQQDQDPNAGNEAAVTRVPVISLIVPDVDKEVSRLRKAGVDILQSPEDELDGRFRTAQIRDNGRHRIELREPIDESGYSAMGR
ncbi:VOC family protein [Microvirga lotononidis]|uniref:Lactoylglutathione lyase-like lyase n=1 Tax=Microvirga lotononidis TaxID=864069 RepID=I4YV01_9HYPH|nr:VOC family protein [Microvirga lotononidis]EIM27793.1 lactoylglutathione lyase-like lyase [Microvirga lotononidis]WQO28074.1 VOC family protein [Microvirga lotononidis]